MQGEIVEPNRQCGTCSLCCTALRVDEIGKLAGERCPKLSEQGGCGIHDRRPRVCREYHCHWLRGGLETSDRPDLLNAIIDFAPSALGLHVALVEAEPGAYDNSPRLQALAAQYTAQMTVRISDTRDVMNPGRGIRVLEGGGRESRIAEGWVETFENGTRISRRRIPLIERLARRLQQSVLAMIWRARAPSRRRRFERDG